MLSIYDLKVVTFQVVLAYNFHRSFILFNYGDIAATTQSWMVSEEHVLKPLTAYKTKYEIVNFIQYFY